MPKAPRPSLPVLALCLALVPALPPAGLEPWATFYGGSGVDWTYGVAEVADGGAVSVGCTQSAGAGEYDAWVLRTDADGNVLWEKALGGGAEDKLYAVSLGPSGEIFAAGYTESYGAGGWDVLVVKLGASGQVLWSKAYGGTGYDFLWPGGIVAHEDGGCTVAGATGSFGKGSHDALLMRLDPSGNILWQKAVGGLGDDRAQAMVTDASGNLTVGGFTASYGAGGYDFWLLRFTANGILEWQKTYGGPREDLLSSVTLTPEGGLAIAGSTKNGKVPGQYDYFVAALDDQGTPLWETTLNAAQADSPVSLACSADGTLVLSGQSKSFGNGSNDDAWVVSWSGEGTLLGQRRLYGSRDDYGYGVVPRAEGGFLMTGGTYSYGPLSENAWLVRLDASGSPGATCITTATTSMPSFAVSFPAVDCPALPTTPALATTTISAASPPPFSSKQDCCAVSCSASAEPSGGDAPLTVLFSAASTTSHCTSSVAYVWNFGDNSQGAGAEASHTYRTPGTYNWTLTASSGAVSCTKKGTVVVTVPCSLACEASASGQVGPAPFAVGFSSELYPSNCQGEPAYAWDFGDGQSSSEASPDHLYQTPGTYAWSLTVSLDGASCTDGGSVTVTQPCTFTLSVALSPPTGEAPLDVTFTPTVAHSYCNDPFTYAWTFGDGGTSAASKPTHTFASAGIYSWSVTATSGATQRSAEGILSVLPPCVLNCQASVSPQSGHAPLQVAFEADSAGQNCTAPVAYLWEFGDGSGASTAQGSHTYAEPGTYAWSVTLSSGKGLCSQSGAVTVTGGPPGDCDGDGSVSIGEVQKAINMFLGLQAPGCGVDCNGDGSVSIGEVQKVINAFLGLAAEC